MKNEEQNIEKQEGNGVLPCVTTRTYSIEEVNEILNRQIRLCSEQFIHADMTKETAKRMVLSSPKVCF